MTNRNHSPNGLPTHDWTKEDHAEDLARRIRNYWAVRGYTVQTGVKSCVELGEGRFTMNGIFCIRSNMNNGYPPKDPAAEIGWIASPKGHDKVYVKTQHAMVRA